MSVAAHPSPTTRPTPGWRSWAPTPNQFVWLLVLLLILSNALLWLGLKEARRGAPVTVVGVREMTSHYLAKITTSAISPQELGLRTALFVSVAQDEVKRLTPVRGQLVLARECVLSGEQTDITPQVERVVEARLASASGGLSNVVGPVASSALGSAALGSSALGAAIAPPSKLPSPFVTLPPASVGHR